MGEANLRYARGERGDAIKMCREVIRLGKGFRLLRSFCYCYSYYVELQREISRGKKQFKWK